MPSLFLLILCIQTMDPNSFLIITDHPDGKKELNFQSDDDVDTESTHTSLMTKNIHLAAIRLRSSSTDLRGSLQNDWGRFVGYSFP